MYGFLMIAGETEVNLFASNLLNIRTEFCQWHIIKPKSIVSIVIFIFRLTKNLQILSASVNVASIFRLQSSAKNMGKIAQVGKSCHHKRNVNGICNEQLQYNNTTIVHNN